MQQVVLDRYPEGEPDPTCFQVVDAARPRPGRDEILVQTCDLSLDPYLRTAITGRHLGHSRMSLGDVLPGRSVARVAESDDPRHPVGGWVLAETGWREWAAVPTTAVTPLDVPDGVPRSAALSALGMPGLTAYAAITRHLQPQPGETVAVSSATGGVGSVAGQLARLGGARTVAIVGSTAKADLARDLFGYDAAVLRTSPRWRDELALAAPDGVDGYLHMGDAEVLDGAVGHLAVGARISLCGLMDQYNDGPPTTMAAGPLIGARATVHGMVVYDHQDLSDQHRGEVGPLLASGRLRIHEDRSVGLHRAPAAFARLMSGHNQGKVVVEVSS
nr:NADP-dependent oxidoreductase [Ornithinimicrobium sp. HY1745]